MVSCRRGLGILFLVVMPLASASAGSCSSFLSSITQGFKKRWNEQQVQKDSIALNLAMVVYEAARDNNDVAMGAIGLMQAASVILKNNPAYKEDIEAFKDLRLVLARILSWGNQNNSPVRDAYLKIYVNHKQKMRHLSQDFLKTLLPTAIFPLWRLINRKELSSASIRFPIRALLQTNRLVVERDEFLEQALVAAEHFQSAQMEELLQPIRSRTTWARSLRPVALSALLWFTNLHPLIGIHGITAPETSIDSFHTLHYLARLEQADERFDPDGKKISIIFDADFTKKTFSHPVLQARAEIDDVIDVWRELEFVRVQSKQAQNFAVADSKELQAALKASEDSDIIYVVAHGLPGKISVGDSDLSDLLKQVPVDGSGVAKEKSIVFISCLYGSKTGACLEDEPWIVNGIRLGGKQVPKAVAAATHSLSFQYFGDRSPLTPETVLNGIVRHFEMTGLQIAFSSVGAIQWMILDQRVLAPSPEVATSEPGFRIYDVENNSEAFHPVPESKDMRQTLFAVSSHLESLGADVPEERRRNEVTRWINFVNALARAYQRQGESLFEGPHLKIEIQD
jgi:hypothetical protein